MSASGLTLDLAHLLTPDIPLGGMQGILENLRPYIERDGYSLDAHYPAVFDSISYAGGLYAMPLGQAGPFIWYYNADLLEAAGVPFPDESWDWEEEVLDYGRRLSQDLDGDGDIDRWAMETATPHQNGYEAAFLWALGGRMWNEEGNELLMTSPEAVTMLSFFQDLYQRNLLGRTGNIWQGWNSESYVMTVMGSYGVVNFRNADFRWEVAHPPRFNGQRYSITWAESPFAIPTISAHKELAWEVLKHLASYDGQLQSFLGGVALPTHREVVQDPAFLADSPPNRQLFVDAMAYTRARPDIPRWGEFRPEYRAMMNRIIMGEVAPFEGMLQVKTKVDAALKQ